MSLLVASQILLWVLVLGLALVVLALARQIGVLHERLAPVGALTMSGGPAVGDPAPRVTGRLLTGELLQLGAPLGAGRTQLLLFVSADCPVCKKMIPLAQAVARDERRQLILVGDDAEPAQRAMAARFGVPPNAFVNGPEIGQAFAIGKLPYAVLLDEDGVVAAKGLVNNREHLESLAVSKATGYDSLQSYLRERRAAPVAAEPAQTELQA